MIDRSTALRERGGRRLRAPGRQPGRRRRHERGRTRARYAWPASRGRHGLRERGRPARHGCARARGTASVPRPVRWAAGQEAVSRVLPDQTEAPRGRGPEAEGHRALPTRLPGDGRGEDQEEGGPAASAASAWTRRARPGNALVASRGTRDVDRAV